MPDPVILSACRTAIGTAYRGSLTETSAFDLADAVVSEALLRSGLSADDIDDVVLGEGLYGGGVIARYAAITAGMIGVPGVAVNRHCAAGLTAVQMAAAEIAAGMADAVIAGGTNSQSTSPVSRYRVTGSEEWIDGWISPSHPETPDAPALDMSVTVGWNTAREAGLTRAELDAWALRSHQRAVAAIDDGRFVDEIVPMDITRRDGEKVRWEVDEHPRRSSTAEKLASLAPLHPEVPDFSITAGNSAGLNDAAAALCVASAGLATERGVEPLASVRSWASVGVEPARTGMAPIDAIPKALARVGLSVGDVHIFEINEAFASVPLAACRAFGLDEEIVNVSGSGCSLGHPVAATGARMLATLVYELRRRGGGIGVASMCAGGGMGSATVIEVGG
ncbi:MAG TPA: thiolase family protein [Acidimicrobiales bacterium]